MFKRVLRSLPIVLVFSASSCFAMTYDNRFFPFGQQLYSRSYERYSNGMADAFYVFSHQSRSCKGSDQQLFDVYGFYDLNQIALALEAVGQPNPLRSQWRGLAIPWKMHGHLETLGVELAYNQALSDYVSCGVATSIMHVKSWITLKLETSHVDAPIAGPGDTGELRRDQLQTNTELGICKSVESKTGFGDVDAYIRLGKIWHYPEKFRRIDAGIRGGILFPSGQKRDINNPASIPFGGNGHVGLYGQIDAEFELKEDFKVGLWGRITKRLSKRSKQRVPVLNEPINYGAFVGEFGVDPGANFMLAPYLILEDIREGLGISARYLWIHQDEDSWHDCSRGDRTFAVNLRAMDEFAEWTAEYVSLDVCYDFSRLAVRRTFEPRIYFTFDIPVHWFASHAVSKSYRVLLGAEIRF
jgi:hypothetical protein